MIARIHVMGVLAAVLAACGQASPAGGGGGAVMGTTRGVVASGTTAATTSAPAAPAAIGVVQAGGMTIGVYTWAFPATAHPIAPGPVHVVPPFGPRAYPRGQAGLPGALPGRTLDDAGTPVDMACVERVRMHATALGMDEDAVRLQVATDCE